MYRGKEGRGAELLLNSRENLEVYPRVSLGLGRVNPSILSRIWTFTVEQP